MGGPPLDILSEVHQGLQGSARVEPKALSTMLCLERALSHDLKAVCTGIRNVKENISQVAPHLRFFTARSSSQYLRAATEQRSSSLRREATAGRHTRNKPLNYLSLSCVKKADPSWPKAARGSIDSQELRAASCQLGGLAGREIHRPAQEPKTQRPSFLHCEARGLQVLGEAQKVTMTILWVFFILSAPAYATHLGRALSCGVRPPGTKTTSEAVHRIV